MNIAYGSLALIISFVVSKYCSRFSGSKSKIFLLAFVAEFIAILLLGVLFYIAGWGFFSGPLKTSDLLVKVVGFAVFLAVLVGMKTINQKELDSH